MGINWNELYKIRLTKSDESLDKHDIIKTLLVRKILRKNKKKAWLRIYTEWNLNNNSGIKCDICVENLKEKSIVCYEIQKELSDKYIKEKTEQYKKYEESEMFFKSVDCIFIPLKELSDNIVELNEQLNKYIF